MHVLKAAISNTRGKQIGIGKQRNSPFVNIYCNETSLRLSQKLQIQLQIRGAGRVLGQGGQNSARSAEKKFRLPTLVFSLSTLPYVTVAHPAHRTEADLREKALLAINQEGPLVIPSV